MFDGHGFQFGKMTQFWRWMVVKDAQRRAGTSCPWSLRLKMVTLSLCTSPQLKKRRTGLIILPTGTDVGSDYSRGSCWGVPLTRGFPSPLASSRSTFKNPITNASTSRQPSVISWVDSSSATGRPQPFLWLIPDPLELGHLSISVKE